MLLYVPSSSEGISDNDKGKEEHHLKLTDIVESSDVLITLE